MIQAVIAGFARSPFGLANKGQLADTRPDDLAAAVIRQLVARLHIDPLRIEDVIVGCAFPEAEQGLNIGRMSALLADLPVTVPGMTVNRLCGSSMQAIHAAAGALQLGAGDAFICAGVESMTRVPVPGFNPMPNPALALKLPGAYFSMGVIAELLARRCGITRHEQEVFAVLSHAKAAAAQDAGKFSDERVPITVGTKSVTTDDCIRPGTTVEALSELPPVFEEDGTVTAGTSSPNADGAAAVLVTTEDFARQCGLPMLARIKAIAIAGCEPENMGMGPVAAAQKALRRAGLSIDEIDIVELNEAFSCQALACIRELNIDIAKVNIDGGALALGHPLGATGARLTGKAASLLKREGKKFALATQCIGGGQGIATVLESIE